MTAASLALTILFLLLSTSISTLSVADFLSSTLPSSHLLSSPRSQALASFLFIHPGPPAVCPHPHLSLHTALRKQVQQRSRSCACLPKECLWYKISTTPGCFFVTHHYSYACICACVYFCSFAYSASQCEVRGGVTLADSKLHIFPLLHLLALRRTDRVTSTDIFLSISSPLLSPLHLWLHYPSRRSLKLHIIHAHSSATPVANNRCYLCG